MRYLALVSDYDGTLATHGRMGAGTVAAVERLRASGRRAILVTGRRLDDLQSVCPHLHLFDYVVAENGGVLHAPHTRETTPLGMPPPAKFIERLKSLGVDRVEAGQVVVATWVPHHTTVLQVIQEMGLELLIIFNREAVMVLPAGVNKCSGLDYALRKLGLSFHEAVGVGDAENDHSFLARCECAVAVANAVPSIRQLAAMRRVTCAIAVFTFAGRETGITSRRRISQFSRRSPKASTRKPGCITCTGAITRDGFAMPSKTATLPTRRRA